MPIRFSIGQKREDKKLAGIFSSDLEPFFIPCSEADDSNVSSPELSPNRFFSQRIVAGEFFIDYHIFFVDKEMEVLPKHTEGFFTLFYMLDGAIPAKLQKSQEILLNAGESTFFILNNEPHKVCLLPEDKPYQCMHITIPKSRVRSSKSMFPVFRDKITAAEKIKGGMENQPIYITSIFAGEVIREILECKYTGKLADVFHSIRASELTDSFVLQLGQKSGVKNVFVSVRDLDPREMLEHIRGLCSLQYNQAAIIKELAWRLNVGEEEVDGVYEYCCYVSATNYIRHVQMDIALRQLVDMVSFTTENENLLKMMSGYQSICQFRNDFYRYYNYRAEELFKCCKRP